MCKPLEENCKPETLFFVIPSFNQVASAASEFWCSGFGGKRGCLSRLALLGESLSICWTSERLF